MTTLPHIVTVVGSLALFAMTASAQDNPPRRSELQPNANERDAVSAVNQKAGFVIARDSKDQEEMWTEKRAEASASPAVELRA